MVSAISARRLVVAGAAFVSLVVVAACATDVAGPLSPIAASASVLGPGTCPDFYHLVAEDRNAADANGNGYVCFDGKARYVDDILQPGEPGTCPDGSPLFSVPPGTNGDANGNGWLCKSPGGPTDDVLDDGKDAKKVNGHGNYLDKKADVSFSFHGIATGGKENAKGQFEFHNQAFGTRAHGSVECMVIQGNMAFLAGTVTRSDDGGMGEGSVVGWYAVDNGEPGSGADQVTSPLPVRDPKKGPCSGAQFPAKGPIIESGNIQVH